MFQFFALISLFFIHVFLCVFISFTFDVRIYLIIAFFIVFIPTLFLIQTYSDTIDGNIWSTPFQLFKICKVTSQFFKFLFVLQSSSINSCILIWYNPLMCIRVPARSGIFCFVFINTDITVMCFHSFFLLYIHSLFPFRLTWSVFLALIIIRTQSLFMLICFNIERTC